MDFLDYVLSFASFFITIVVLAVGGVVCSWLRAKTDNEAINSIVENVVLSTSQTLVKGLKKDENWNADSQEKVFEFAIGEIGKLLKKKNIKVDKDVMAHLIESTLNKQK